MMDRCGVEKACSSASRYLRYDFREGRPRLAAWYERITRHPSVVSHWNVDFEGDDSAANCQRHVREAVALRDGAAS